MAVSTFESVSANLGVTEAKRVSCSHQRSEYVAITICHFSMGFIRWRENMKLERNDKYKTCSPPFSLLLAREKQSGLRFIYNTCRANSASLYSTVLECNGKVIVRP